MEFEKWPRIPRLSKESVVVTEKIDGSNACIRIRFYEPEHDNIDWAIISHAESGQAYTIWVQSRTRFLKATKHDDNFGFATWVKANSRKLVDILGPGDHYGEWWGSKIQRGYGLTNGERRFSLFNAPRWEELIDIWPGSTEVEALCMVPILYSGAFIDMDISVLKDVLRLGGSLAAQGHAAEGMVIYLRELRASYKILLENDDIHKWEVK